MKINHALAQSIRAMKSIEKVMNQGMMYVNMTRLTSCMVQLPATLAIVQVLGLEPRIPVAFHNLSLYYYFVLQHYVMKWSQKKNYNELLNVALEHYDNYVIHSALKELDRDRFVHFSDTFLYCMNSIESRTEDSIEVHHWKRVIDQVFRNRSTPLLVVFKETNHEIEAFNAAHIGWMIHLDMEKQTKLLEALKIEETKPSEEVQALEQMMEQALKMEPKMEEQVEEQAPKMQLKRLNRARMGR
jgi:hypothetical protein